METENKPSDQSQPEGKRRRKRWWRLLLAILVVLIAFVVSLPYLASIGPIRNFLLRVVSPGIEGSVHAGSARLGWFSPILFENVEVRSADGQPVVSIARLQGDRELWRLLADRSNLGEFRIEQPHLNVVLEKNGSNLSRVFAGREPEEKTSPKPPDMAVAVKLIDGSVEVRGADSPKSWTAGPINFAFQLKPGSASADGQPRLEIEPGVVLPRTEITPEVCRDLLKYIAPIVADTTEVGGSFSMELDRWEFPMSDFSKGEGAGRVTIHDLELGPGPLVRELATALKVPPKLVTMKEEPIVFWMADGRVHHSQLTFQLERLTLRTEGSVGADGSLEMTAELTVPADKLGDNPIAAALARQKLKIPIKGTLQKPKIDLQGLAGSAIGVADGMVGELLQGENVDLGSALEAIGKWRQERAKRRQEQDQQPGAQRRRPLDWLLRGGSERVPDSVKPDDKTEQAPPGDQPKPPGQPDADRSRQRPLGRLLRGVLEGATKAAGEGGGDEGQETGGGGQDK